MRTKIFSLDDAKGFLFNQNLEDSLADHSTQRFSSSKVAKAALRVALERDLTPRQRECVQLYYFQGLTMEQTGERLGIGKPTVHRHIKKAKARLERALAFAIEIQRYLEEDA